MCVCGKAPNGGATPDGHSVYMFFFESQKVTMSTDKYRARSGPTHETKPGLIGSDVAKDQGHGRAQNAARE
jgi:hypothetical protein